MIPQPNRHIRRRPVSQLEADPAQYRAIVHDMVENAGPLIPDPNWLVADHKSRPAPSYDKRRALQVAQSEEHFLKVSSMQALMKNWVGRPGPPRRSDLAKYRRFLLDCDPLALWEANMQAGRGDLSLSLQDLGSLMDLDLIYAFAASPERKLTTVLEIGGGYGRLAEAAFNIFGRSVRYVLVDAVPSSLYYAHKYLSRACPDARIDFYYDPGFDLSACDIAILPPWHFQAVNTLRYDVCVNIESMQEMSQHHVDHYLQLFQSVAVDGATIYVANAHDYYFRGKFNYPDNWRRVFCANTPRSWTRIHPTEIFIKTTQDWSQANAAVSAAYRCGLDAGLDDVLTSKGLKRLARHWLKR